MDITVPLYWIFLSNQGQPSHNDTELICQRRPRVFKSRAGLNDYTNEEIRHHFRLNKTVLQDLYEQVRDALESDTKRSSAIPGITKLLATLHLFATGTFQYVVAVKLGLSQPTFSRCFRQVIEAILTLAPRYIHFPTSQEMHHIKQKFYLKYGFPHILGLVDCTHVAFLPKASVEANYRNRKQYHSINVQIICGPELEVLDVVARYPGSSHDAYIMANSEIGQAFENGEFGDSLLLVDNGYRLTPWLMTPYLYPSTLAEERFNLAHKRTRSTVERLFGILKSRFRCLDITGGSLLYDPELVCKIVVCCCILNNIANTNNIEIEIADDLSEHITEQGTFGDDSSSEGRQRRLEITNRFFSQ